MSGVSTTYKTRLTRPIVAIPGFREPYLPPSQSELFVTIGGVTCGANEVGKVANAAAQVATYILVTLCHSM